jgi:S-adenosylmethionine:tRNA ribosyltransferase-isomerase
VRTDELDYAFDDALIAERPLEERDAARLCVLDRASGSVEHARVRELPRIAAPSLFVVNDTRVIPARLFGTKPSGGRVELLLVERTSMAEGHERWLALGRASKGLRPGASIALGPDFRAEIVDARGEGAFEIALYAQDVASAIAAHGEMPLPPYLRRSPDASDSARYQTIFAANEGAVAAPTAGLHFSEALVAELGRNGHEIATVTLHVGPGTFAPVRTADLSEHPMHAERYHVPDETVAAIERARRDQRTIAAVGTTVVRTLESAAEPDGSVRAGGGLTRLLISPPYEFRVVQALLTNFHLPRSTLLALVMAFGGVDLVRSAYAAAVAERYRFYSYGDAMWIR